jgi:glycosyltransferase involved in cell wall biosynthesis
MLTGHSLVYFAPEPWDGLWRNRHQLMSLFARENKVLFVERRSHLRPTIAAFRHGDLGLADLGHASPRRIADNLFVYRYPAWAPISGRSPLKDVTRLVRHLSLLNALRSLDMAHPIVWLSHPGMVDLIEEIPSSGPYSPRLLLYHVVDEYSAYTDVTPDRRRWVEEREREMLDRVDAVIVVSKTLYAAKHPFHPSTYVVPNGVDHRAYSAALDDPYLPQALSGIRTPRLGYSGLIGDKLDLQMLKALAEQHPEWSLVFLGEARAPQQAETWQSMLQLPNVHYLGRVDAAQVPFYLKGFHVGLMPYVVNRASENISPLKLYDYLAAGLPVASMNIPAAREFHQYIHLADRPQDFAQAVTLALSDTAQERRLERRQVAAQHTWEARVEQLSSLIQSHLAGTDSSGRRASMQAATRDREA